jgi:hypothetical protein
MRIRVGWLILLLTFSCLVVGGALFITEKSVFEESGKVRIAEASVKRNSQPQKVEADCRLYDPFNHDEQLYKKYLLQQHGYAKATNLEQAILDYQRLALCSNLGRGQPPLTESELLASLRRSLSVKTPTLPSFVIEGFNHILSKQEMPIGSLIEGVEVAEGLMNKKSWRILIYIGLDKHIKLPKKDDTLNVDPGYYIR